MQHQGVSVWQRTKEDNLCGYVPHTHFIFVFKYDLHFPIRCRLHNCLPVYTRLRPAVWNLTLADVILATLGLAVTPNL